MASTLINWISTFSQLLQLGLVLMWAFQYRKLPSPARWLGWYLLLNLVVQMAALWLIFQQGNNLALLHLNTALEFVFFSLLFRELYRFQAWFRPIFPYWLGSIILLLVVNSVWLEPIDTFNSSAKALVSSILIAYVVLYFFDTYGRVDISRGQPRALSWVCFATMIYYSGSLLIYLFPHISLNKTLESTYAYLWVLNVLLYVVFLLIVLVAMIFLVKEKKIAGVPQSVILHS